MRFLLYGCQLLCLSILEETKLYVTLLRKKATGCSSARFRVHVWGACGRKFESCHPDKEKSPVN